MIRPYLLIVLILLVSLCTTPTGKTDNAKPNATQPAGQDFIADSVSEENSFTGVVSNKPNYFFGYDLDEPYHTYILPNSLIEISGVAYLNDNEILCVQDEKANIYTYDLNEEKIISEYDFGKDGDYEDIAISGQQIFVIRSDGQIFEVDNFNEKNPKVKDHNTFLSAKNNTEGLAYDSVSNALLIACKGSPEIEKANSYDGFKAVYQFELNVMKMNVLPSFLIDLGKLDDYKNNNGLKKFSLGLAKKLHLIESETNFHPSGISIHPLSNEIYLISSVGKLMIIMDRLGNILDVQDLDSKIFRQPEGICFSPSGDLFISNEGNGGKATILKFKFQPKN